MLPDKRLNQTYQEYIDRRNEQMRDSAKRAYTKLIQKREAVIAILEAALETDLTDYDKSEFWPPYWDKNMSTKDMRVFMTRHLKECKRLNKEQRAAIERNIYFK